jgi:hypothetical protein
VRSDAAADGRATRSDWWWRFAFFGVGCVVGGAIGVVGCAIVALVAGHGKSSGYEPTRMTGCLELPPGVSARDLTVRAMRGNASAGACTPAADGSFELTVGPGGPVDLHVSDWETWRDPYPRDGSAPEPAPTHAVEGLLRDVSSGADNVRIALVRRALADVTLRVLRPDGGPAAGARIRLESFHDSVGAVADAIGVARVQDLPPRPWWALARASSDPSTSLHVGHAEFVPSGQDVVIDIPTAVRMHARLAPGLDANLLSGGGMLHSAMHVGLQGPWAPEPDGTMTFLVSPGVPTLTLRATYKEQLDERTTRETPIAVGTAAVHEGATVLLEAIAR